MGNVTIEALVDGGKASAGPPIGNQLGPLKVDIGKVVSEINEKTKDMAGMKVPVKIIVNDKTKEYSIEIGTPPISALIKKELGIQKASSEPGRVRAADLTPEQASKIARVKFATDDEAALNQVRGTARSMGISVGRGAVTDEERKSYEEAKKAEEAEAEAKKES